MDQPPTLDPNTNEWVAVVTVYRDDQSHGYKYPGRYPANGSNKAYAPEMALKAAEAHALRRAFAITGLPVEDEHREDQAPRSGLGAVQAAQVEQEPPVAPPLDVEDEPYTYAESEPLDVKSNLAKRLFKTMAEAGIAKDKAHDFMSETLGREVTSSKDLTVGETRRLLRHLPTQEA